jgi:outer membrane protein assembly complex protein YaeT
MIFLPLLSEAQSRRMDLSNLSEKTQQSLFERFPQLKTNSFTFADLDELVRHMISQEQYDSAEIVSSTENGIQIFRINLGVKKRIGEIEIQGNSNVSEQDIRRELLVAEKSRLDENELVETAERIRQLYERRGFPESKIEVEMKLISKVDVKVSFNIREGVQTRIQKVSVVSENSNLEKDLQRILNRRQGKVFTETMMVDLRDDLRNFLSKNGYYRADLIGPELQFNATGSEVSLSFKAENPIKYLVSIKGTSQMRRGRVYNALGLDQYFTTNPNIASEMANRVRAFYLKEGYARAEVASESRQGRSRYEYVIDLRINEGPKVKIEKIEIAGTYSGKADDYVEFILKNSSGLVADGYYVKDDFEQGLKNFVIDRQNSGFLNARILSSRTSFGKNKDRVNIFLQFEEGPQTRLEKVEFEGNLSFSREQLLPLTELTPGRELSLRALEESLGKLRNFYRSSGYLEMRIKNEKDLISYSEANTKAQVVYEIEEGPQIRVGQILVEGNSLTKDSVILKEVEFKTGDVLTPQLIEESISRLQKLGHFNSIDIRTLEERTQISNRTIIIRVSDREPGLFNFGIGANNERTFTVRGYTGIAYRNILGTGRGVSARVEGNYNVTDIQYPESRITLGYLEPYMFNTRVRGRVNLTRSKQVTDFDKEIITEVNQTTYTLEQDLTSNILFSYELWSLASVIDFQRFNNSAIFPRTEQNIATTGPSLDLDFRDHPFNPTTGTFTRFNVEYSAPWLGSSEGIEYWRGFASTTLYTPLKTGWVWANSFRLGYLKNLSQDGGVPFDKKGLLLGGQSTVRGFQPGEAFPGEEELGTDRYLLKTEANLYLLKSELRFPVYGNIGGALFYDGGAVTIRGVDIQDPYRDSVGFALRYVTPVGAVSLEWGWKLDRKADRGESQFPFHFSIGTF